jgi:hypothetical protein
MSPAFLHAPARKPSEVVDRRLRHRYPITLEVGYKLLNGVSAGSEGAGTTRNISSGGIAFEAQNVRRAPPRVSDIASHRNPVCAGPLTFDDAFTLGARIELRIQWPFLLNGRCPLILQMFGSIVRIDGKLICVETTQHEFKTAGSYATKVKHGTQ